MKTYLQLMSYRKTSQSFLKEKAKVFLWLIFFTFLLSFSYENVQAQCPNNLISNSNFSNGLNQWQTFSGYLPNPINNTMGCLDTFMVLRAYNNPSILPPFYGDGMYQPAIIDSGKCYDLCLCMASTLGLPGNNVQFWAATNDPGITYDNLLNNTYPPGEAALIGVLQVNSTTAQQYCINNWYAQKNFTRLIIFNSTNNPASSSVLIDNICFEENLSCTPCDYANIAPNFSANANGTLVQFTDLSTISVGNITAWQWNFGDPGNAPNDTSTLQNPIFNFSSNGVFIVCLKVYAIVNGAPCEDSICFCVPVYGNPVNTDCDTTGMNNGFTFTISNDTVLFSASSNTAIGFLWDFGDPLSAPNNTSILQNPQHVFSSPGSYTVCLELTFPGSLGTLCRDTICQTITILTTGVNENSIKPLLFYPNPVSDIITIINANENSYFEIFDYTGSLIMEGTGKKVHVAALPKGIYIIRSESRFNKFIKL